MRVGTDWANARGRADRAAKAPTVPAYVIMVLAIVFGSISCDERTRDERQAGAPTAPGTPSVKQPAPTALATPTLANWVEIPAGDFLMGAQKEDPALPNKEDPALPNYDPEAQDNESPVHKVRLSAYRIAKFPVTVAEFQRFVDAGGYTKKEYWLVGGFGLHQEPGDWARQLENPDRPVAWVSWYAASAYAAWANCRLPTEAEWERAARGTEARKYPWGNDAPNPALLNFSDSAIGHATSVGTYPAGATPEGVFDMAGNVWEWCQDGYGDYKADDQVDPRGPAEGQSRVLRGGSWVFSALLCRSACRHEGRPGFRYTPVGFRVVSGAP